MIILGLSAFYHDSAAALIENGAIVAAAQEERFTRKKHTHDFPREAISYCLGEAAASIDDLDAVVFYDKPLLKFERLIETYYRAAPKGLPSFLASMPLWIKDKIFLKKHIRDQLHDIHPYDRKKLRLLFPEHHLSHAASAFFCSRFDEAAILTIDGVGEWATATLAQGKQNTITMLKELRFPHSVGLLYSAFTYWLGFTVNSGEYKLMGLAPYGDPGGERTREYARRIRDELIDMKIDGSISLRQDYFRYATGLRMTNDRKWQTLFDLPRRLPDEDISQAHCDLAAAIQQVTEDIVLRMARHLRALTGANNLCLAGGVALNCVANGKLMRTGMFDDIFIQPAAGDAGGALGAALAAYHLYFRQPRTETGTNDLMRGAYLGPAYTDLEIKRMCLRRQAVYKQYASHDELCDVVADRLNAGRIVGWFQGRMEFGPRALGNRSILADARRGDMQKTLNLHIKYREGFRPFAPAVLAERSGEYFELDGSSPYMLLTADVREERRRRIPDGYATLPLWDKLYHERSDIPAVTHIDFSARVQTVHRDTNPLFHTLLHHFRERTGSAVLINTSFNVRGEPIVCTPDDAYRCFMRTEMDMLVIGRFLFEKSQQPLWIAAEHESFQPD